MQDGSSDEKNTRVVPTTNTETKSRTRFDEVSGECGQTSRDWTGRRIHTLDDFLPRLIELIS